MTLELNVFNVCKQPADDGDLHEVDSIEELVYQHFTTSSSFNPLETCFENESEFDITDSDSVSNLFQVQGKRFWKPEFEKLFPSANAPVPSSVKAPKLDLKPLPSNLKYAFLGENETFPVISLPNLMHPKKVS